MALLKDLTVFGPSHLIGDAFGGNITANKFITTGGTASQFLKGDGTLDSNTYATTSSLSNYVKKSGDTMTGNLTMNVSTASDTASGIKMQYCNLMFDRGRGIFERQNQNRPIMIVDNANTTKSPQSVYSIYFGITSYFSNFDGPHVVINTAGGSYQDSSKRSIWHGVRVAQSVQTGTPNDRLYKIWDAGNFNPRHYLNRKAGTNHQLKQSLYINMGTGDENGNRALLAYDPEENVTYEMIRQQIDGDLVIGHGAQNASGTTTVKGGYITLDSVGQISALNTIDTNGQLIAYPRGNSNTAFKANLIIKQQSSSEATGDNWTASNASFGIQFNRFWTSGGNPSGETACAGIFATISSSWRGGLVFRTKNNTTQGGTHDITALRLKPSGIAEFSQTVTIASTISGNYNEGLRITRASNSWAGITFGSTGDSGLPSDGWFVASDPTKTFLIGPTSTLSSGLNLVKNGDAKWKGNIIYHAGNSNLSTVDWAAKNLSAAGTLNVTGASTLSTATITTATITTDNITNAVVSGTLAIPKTAPSSPVYANVYIWCDTTGNYAE